MTRKGIDVSAHQGLIDWGKVKSSGDVNFAMIRSSYGFSTVDQFFYKNVQGCIDNNIPYGFYHFIYAITVEDAKKEAEHFLKTISPYRPLYPVCIDFEYTKNNSFLRNSERLTTDMAIAFGKVLEDAGYYTMLYANVDWLDDYYIHPDIELFDLWLAHWATDGKQQQRNQGIWQCGKDYIPGIDDKADIDYCYKDYPSIIKKNNLNIGIQVVEKDTGDDIEKQNVKLTATVKTQAEEINRLQNIISQSTAILKQA